jgi:hypothetical protein
VCLVGGHSVEDGQLSEWDSVVAGPAAGARGLCASRHAGPTEAEEQNARCRQGSRSHILFLGSDAISVEEHVESDCGAHYSGGTSVSLTALDDGQRLNLENLLEPARRDDLIKRAMEAGQAEFADFGDLDTAAASPDDSLMVPRLELLHEWGIERGRGRWQVVGHATCSPYVACGDRLRRFSIPGFPPPARVVGHDALAPTLARLQIAFPGVRDAVASPRGDLVVALSDDSLLVFTPKGGQLGAPVLRQQLYGRIVMAQWATGRFVPIWTAETRNLLTR